MKIIINGAGGRMGRALRNMAQEKNIKGGDMNVEIRKSFQKWK